MVDNVSGLRWRKGATDRLAIWRASKPALASGFPIKSRIVWRGENPSAEDISRITDRCLALAHEQRDWLRSKRRERPGRQAALKGEVYFIRAGAKVKIGFSTSVTRRLSQLQTGSIEPLELIGAIKCSADRERHIHAMFGRYRLHREWFQIEGELADYLRQQFGWRTPLRTPAHSNSASY